MARLKGLLFGCFLLSLIPSAHAARFSGEYLLHLCASDEQGQEIVAGGHIACQAYIAGIMDYHSILKSMGATPGIDFCVPDGEGLYAVQGKIESYIFRNRAQHNTFIAAPGVAMGLFAAYPCK